MKLIKWLEEELIKEKFVEVNRADKINNSLSIPESFLAKSISSRYIDDGATTVDMILNLHRNRESGKIQIECIMEAQMSNNKLSTGIEEIDKELSKGSPLEEFVKFNLDTELQPFQKQILSFIENKKNISEDEFRTQYMMQPLQIGKTFKNTKRKDRKERCGDCTFFGDKGCTTSYLEAKHGNKNTPACSEFSPKILGTKATMIIIDDPLKES